MAHVDITAFARAVLYVIEPPPPGRAKPLTLNKIVDELKKKGPRVGAAAVGRSGAGAQADAVDCSRLKRLQCERLVVHMILQGVRILRRVIFCLEALGWRVPRLRVFGFRSDALQSDG
jgi:hypothetical protein